MATRRVVEATALPRCGNGNLVPFSEASYFEASERVADDRCAGWWARVMWVQLHSAASEL